MKTLRFIGLAIIAIVMSVNFSACGDDDDEGIESPDYLIGVWQGTVASGWETDDGEKFNYSGEDLSDARVTFKEDGTWVEEYRNNNDSPWYEDESGTWKLEGQKLIRTVNSMGGALMEEDWASFYENVLSLTKNKLVMEQYGKEDDGDEMYIKLEFARIK